MNKQVMPYRILTAFDIALIFPTKTNSMSLMQLALQTIILFLLTFYIENVLFVSNVVLITFFLIV